ncbi:MAG: DUF4386 family protein [Acidimicrobiales bacterium]
MAAVGFVVSGDTPDTDASGAVVISHYEDEGKIYVSLILLMIAAIALMFFASVLRMRLREAGWETLATTAFGGGVCAVVGLAIFGVFQIALLDASDLGQEQVAQALNIIDSDNFFPAIFGIAIMYLATGWHCLRSGVLPKWLAWVSLVLALLSVAGPLGFIAFLAFPLWSIIVSVLLFRRPARVLAGPTGPTAIA